VHPVIFARWGVAARRREPDAPVDLRTEAGIGRHTVGTMRLTDRVREHSAAIAAGAKSVRIVPDRLVALDPVLAGPPEPEHHFVDGSREDIARFVFCLTAINFGSGWWPTVRKRPGMSGYFTMATGLTERFRAHGAWSNDELRQIGAGEVADALGQDPGHELMSLYADALRQLGRWLGDRAATKVVDDVAGSAELLAEQVAVGMAYFDDRGFYKRAQILAPELERFEVAEFNDLDRLTLFADNLVPHVLRVDRALVYSDLLAQHIDDGRLLPSGTWEREIRACAIQAVEQLAAITGAAPHELDMALWSHGQTAEYKAQPRHRHRSVFY
jgi:hypothetical protein